MKGLNVPILIISLGVSILLWMFVYSQNMKPLTPVVYTIKMTQDGLPDRYIVTDMDDVFRFTAMGPEAKLRDNLNAELSALVDLSNAVPGTRNYPVKVLPETVQEYITNKNMTTKVTIEPVESKLITVHVEGQGRLKNPQLRLTDTVADPTEVTVRGAKSLVDRATKARVRLDLSTVDTSATRGYTLGVEVLDQSGRPLEQGLIRTDPLFVRVTPVLTVAPDEKTVFVSPRFKGQTAQGFTSSSFRVTPPQVTVAGPSLILAGISKVQTEPIDIEGLRDTTTFTVRLQIPPGMTVEKGQDTVQVRINVTPATIPQPPSTPETSTNP